MFRPTATLAAMMRSNRHFIRTPRLSVGQQRAHMMAVWPELETRMDSGILVVRGTVQPSPVTRAYRIRVTYADHAVPKSFIITPALERRSSDPERPIPHTYGALTPGKERPGLYDPATREWTSTMPIATTIMPWLLSWLVDYELWFATGDWLGGGVTHAAAKRPDEPPPGEAAA